MTFCALWDGGVVHFPVGDQVGRGQRSESSCYYLKKTGRWEGLTRLHPSLGLSRKLMVVRVTFLQWSSTGWVPIFLQVTLSHALVSSLDHTSLKGEGH